MLRKLYNRTRLAGNIIIKGKTPIPIIRAEIPSITVDEIAEIKQFFSLEKFFILGHARSGTTLLARLVRVHPEVHCNWQAHFFTRAPYLQSLVNNPEVGEWLTRRSNRWNRGSDLTPVILRGVCDLILERDARQFGKKIVGDKSPNSLNDQEAVLLMYKTYPDARLIYVIRDGRDAALSHRFQSFVDKAQYLTQEDLKIREAFIQKPEPFLKGERSIFTAKGIERAAKGWVRNVNETHQAAQDLYGEKYHVMQFEKLTYNPWEEMTRVWHFLGANLSLANLADLLHAELQQNPDADWQNQKASQLAQSLQKGKSGNWREMFTPRDQQIFLDIASSTLKTWGYLDE